MVKFEFFYMYIPFRSKISKYRVVAGTSDLLDENKIRKGKKSSYSIHKVKIQMIFIRFMVRNK